MSPASLSCRGSFRQSFKSPVNVAAAERDDYEDSGTQRVPVDQDSGTQRGGCDFRCTKVQLEQRVGGWGAGGGGGEGADIEEGSGVGVVGKCDGGERGGGGGGEIGRAGVGALSQWDQRPPDQACYICICMCVCVFMYRYRYRYMYANGLLIRRMYVYMLYHSLLVRVCCVCLLCACVCVRARVYIHILSLVIFF
jgi:hypothetical protein